MTATAEDYTGKPPPAGALVMTMFYLAFDPSVLTATGSKVVFYVDNKEPNKSDCPDGSDVCHQHGLLVLGPRESLLGKTDTVAPGHQAVLTLDGLRPGLYKFYCPVSVHRFNGMTGQVRVN